MNTKRNALSIGIHWRWWVDENVFDKPDVFLVINSTIGCTIKGMTFLCRQ
ncbi:MAG: hypothetical protein ACK5M7_10875 [Draconibacterium sp.]